MPTNIETSRAFVKERTEKTRAAQATLSTDSLWNWPPKSLAQWDADIVSMDATANGSLAKNAAAQKVNMLAARGFVDARLDALHKYTLMAVEVMRVRVVSPVPLPGLRPVVDDLTARGDSRRAIEEEADGLIAAWEEWEEETNLPFIPLAGKTLPDYKLLTEGAVGSGQLTNPSLATLKKNYKTATTKWRRAEGLLNALYSRCEDECIAWYAEATAVWAAGTPEGDMIRGQVPTDYTPTPPAPPAPPAPPPPPVP